ncbi:MAG: hypothetical protein AAFR36_31795, partial [Bacteroidota bacterium]
MRIWITLLFWASICTIGKALDASLSFARFSSPQGTYLELYLHVAGQTVEPQQLNDSTYQAAVDVLIFFEQEGQVVSYDKYRLNSPTGERIVDFVDMKRYPLPAGIYDLKVEISDAQVPERIRRYSTSIDLEFSTTEVAQSDIQLLAAVEQTEVEGPMVKNGLLMEPLPFNYYGRGANVLTFYHEIYNSATAIAGPFVVSYRIDKIENGTGNTMLIGHKRQEPSAVNPIVMQMDIGELPSGNYQLVVDVRDRERTLLSSRSIAFQRSNPMIDVAKFEEAMAQVVIEEEFVYDLDESELEYSLRAIGPILPQSDVEL